MQACDQTSRALKFKSGYPVEEIENSVVLNNPLSIVPMARTAGCFAAQSD